MVLLVASVGVTPGVSRAQQVEAMTVGVRRAAVRTVDDAPDVGELAGMTGLSSAAWAVGGGGIGLLIDDAYCKRHHIETEGFIFAPCTFYTAAATPVGWFGGSVAGAAFAATRIARERGCRTRPAFWRSLGGAALGVIPGSLIVAGHPPKYPPRRSMFVAGAPLLAAAGATLAVAGCHS